MYSKLEKLVYSAEEALRLYNSMDVEIDWEEKMIAILNELKSNINQLDSRIEPVDAAMLNLKKACTLSIDHLNALTKIIINSEYDKIESMDTEELKTRLKKVECNFGIKIG